MSAKQSKNTLIAEYKSKLRDDLRSLFGERYALLLAERLDKHKVTVLRWLKSDQVNLDYERAANEMVAERKAELAAKIKS